MTTEGDRKARLKDSRNEWLGAGLNIGGDPGREDRVCEVAELVDAAAGAKPELVEEDLVLEVGAELVAVLRVRGEGDVEVVAAGVAAVGQDVLPGDHDRVADLDVVGLRLEVELQRA